MKIPDNKMLDRFRGPGVCELCGKSCRNTEPHHVIAKGMGGGRQLDVRINLVRVGSTPNFECRCHNDVDTKEGQQKCWRVIAAREGSTPDKVEAACRFILRLDGKWSKEMKLRKIVAECDDMEAALVMRSLIEAGEL